MKVTKGSAFVWGMCSLLIIHGSSLAVGIKDAVGGIVLGLVGIVTAYIGGNVADNGVKGKFYKEELANKEK